METKVLAETANDGGRTTVSLEMCEDGGVQVFFHDVGAVAQRTFGDADYEAWVKVPPDQIARLAFALLAEKFAGDRAALSALRDFCEANGVRVEGGVWT